MDLDVMDDDFRSITRKRKRKNDNNSSVRVTASNSKGSRCPVCQIPIVKENEFIHSSTTCEGAKEDAEECPEGLNCQEKYVEHFQRFSHFKLALFRSCEESKLIKEDFSHLNVSNIVPDAQANFKKKKIFNSEISLNCVSDVGSTLVKEDSNRREVSPDVCDNHEDHSARQNISDKRISLKSDLKRVSANIVGHVIFTEEVVTSKKLLVDSGTSRVSCDICNKNENGELSHFNPNIKVTCSSKVEDKDILCALEQHPIELNVIYNQQGYKILRIDFLSHFEVRKLQITLGNCCHFIDLNCVIGRKNQFQGNINKDSKTLAFFDFNSLGFNECSSGESTLMEKLWINRKMPNINNTKNDTVCNKKSFGDIQCNSSSVNTTISCTDNHFNSQVSNNDVADSVKSKRDETKEKWKNLFKQKEKKSSINVSPAISSRPSNLDDKLNIPKKQCPFYKRIPETSFAVDAFQYGIIPGVSHYFLTHFHSDHYGGLTKKFKQRIICSPTTAALVVKKLYVEPEYLLVVKVAESIFIGSVKITPLDANHCPGSLMFLFQLITGNCYLHVGDFRANAEMEKYPAFSCISVDILYLDTTYCNPRYEFPSQEEVVSGVVRIALKRLKSEPATLIVSGTYTIGKEKVFMGIANAIKSNIWAPKPKRDVLKCLNDENLISRLVDNPCNAQVHVWPMGKLNHKELEQHLKYCNNFFKRILAFNPSGWNYQKQCAIEDIPAITRGNVTIISVPYSEHSSYNELRKFVKFLKPGKVVPTVGSRDNTFSAITQCCNKWLRETEEKNGQQKLTSFFTSDHF